MTGVIGEVAKAINSGKDSKFLMYTNKKQETDVLCLCARKAVHKCEDICGYMLNVHGDSYKEKKLFAMEQLEDL